MKFLNSKYIKDIEFPVNFTFTSPKDLYLALALVEEEKERLSLKLKEVEQVEPNLSKGGYKVIGDPGDAITVSELARNLKVGPLNLFKFLYKEGLLLTHNVVNPAYQQYFNIINKHNPRTRDSYEQVLVNPQGAALITSKLKSLGYLI